MFGLPRSGPSDLSSFYQPVALGSSDLLAADPFDLPVIDSSEIQEAAVSSNVLAADSSNLLTADMSDLLPTGSPKCISTVGRLRARNDINCYGNSDYQNSLGIAIPYIEKVINYWCLASGMAGFGNIPVCSEKYQVPSMFVHLRECDLMIGIDYTLCNDKKAYCCQIFLPNGEFPLEQFQGSGYWLLSSISSD